ncbi:MAG: hypothetical protein U1F81_24055 [Verrucomicrobiaceae bacterium]|jgi:hypothetical protein
MKLTQLSRTITLLCLSLGRLAAEEIPPAPDYAEIGRNQKALMKYSVFPFKYKVPETVLNAFYHGDYSLLEKLAAEKNVVELLNQLAATFPVTYGEHLFPPPPLQAPARVPDFYKPNKEFGARMREEIKQRLAAIPGHTELLVQGIDAASKLKGGHGMRMSYIGYLGRIGSMEAIQQLGRYLYDDRNLEGSYFYGGPDSGMNPPVSNAEAATRALHRALGDDGQTMEKRLGVEETRLWWESEEGRPYREWKFENGNLTPPPRKGTISLPPPAPQDKTAPASLPTPNEARPTAIWPVILILAFAALAAVLGFTKLRRR